MKPVLALAALFLVLQRPPQAGAVAVERGGEPPLGVSEPLAVLNAERAWSGADAFWLLLNDGKGRDQHDERASQERAALRRHALRAIGRLEDPGQVRRLLALPDVPFTPVADAIAQSLYGFDPQNDPRLLAEVAVALRAAVLGPQGSTQADRMERAAAMSRAMSHIVFSTAEQVSNMESLLLDAMRFSTTSTRFSGAYLATVRGLEALARVNARLVHYDEETVDLLAKAAKGQTIHADDPAGRLYALTALVAARALEPDVEEKALADQDWAVRRAAMAVLAGGGGGVEGASRLEHVRAGFADSNPHVRYEAVRAWGRHFTRTNGCQPLVDALKDNDLHVALQAADLLGGSCMEDEEITRRLDAETAVPMGADWPRPTHAFVALAKRSPEKSAIHMEAFTTHAVWWVRMYAAFAAAGAKDLLRLDRLAYDDNDNVREAALPHLRALDGERADRAILAALERTDVQLIHTAAGLIKDKPASQRYVQPLVASLERLTRVHSMSSRDGRIALLDAIERHGRPDDHTQLRAFLRDFDPAVAARAAEIVTRLSGIAAKAEPAAAAHVPTQPFADLRQCVVVNMSSGRPFHMRMDPAAAPIAVEQFLRLATMERYYNGLTIHRIVPNFVVQGGSPNANEYSGYKEFLRDEIGASNVRGSVGLSIRGRNTGDGQFYINLIDNARLDGGYTVFAHVFDEDMEAVDRVQEGDVMRSIDSIPCPQPVQRR